MMCPAIGEECHDKAVMVEQKMTAIGLTGEHLAKNDDALY